MGRCEYGCGREAKHQLKNGKWCCQKSTKSCPKVIERSAIARTGAKRTKTQIRNISNGHVGQTSNKKGKNYDEIYGLEKAFEIKKKMRNKKLITKDIDKIKNKYSFLFQVEEFREDTSGNVLVRCKNHACNKWFIPSYPQLYERHRALTNPSGFEENNFYCSKKCKITCIVYGSNANGLEQISEHEIQIWAEQVKKRDGYICQICGSSKDLHAHHIKPKKEEPFFALDPENGKTLCKDCHFEYFHKKGTKYSTGNLSRTTCSK